MRLNITILLFVGSCLITYWKHGSWLGAINCPLCRQKVILLYNASGENQQDNPSKRIVRDIRDYNKRFSGQPRPALSVMWGWAQIHLDSFTGGYMRSSQQDVLLASMSHRKAPALYLTAKCLTWQGGGNHPNKNEGPSYFFP
ncbi:hypothetical protein UY3_06325 [Chelonia mydas]|uniref:Uncharacterized protein n=1 Tax=Chelonia mydas TaxID=8469 RepID=M7BL88_CHEMY|nr:hypothetical protein UY3_06325 [Chelonia mydas]